MINLELNKSSKRKRQRKLLKLLLRPNLKPRLTLLKKESELPEPRLRRIVSSMRLLDKPNTNLFNKELLRRRPLPKPNKRLLKLFKEESKLKNLLLP